MMFRANHIYLLLSALLNVIAGLYLVRSRKNLARFFQRLGSVLLILSTLLFFTAFWLETAAGSFDRPISYLAVVFSVTAIGTLCFSAWLESRSDTVSR